MTEQEPPKQPQKTEDPKAKPRTARAPMKTDPKGPFADAEPEAPLTEAERDRKFRHSSPR